MDKAKITVIDYIVSSLENGASDEDVTSEIEAITILAKSIKNNFDRALALSEIEAISRKVAV